MDHGTVDIEYCILHSLIFHLVMKRRAYVRTSEGERKAEIVREIEREERGIIPEERAHGSDDDD
jgi:hypothetical protein